MLELVLVGVGGVVVGTVLTALTYHFKPKAALEAELEYLKRKYKEHTGKAAPTKA